MNFEFTEDQLMIQEAARDFAQREIAPVAAQFDERGEFPEETIRKAGELGLMGIEVPEQYGGAGLDAVGFAPSGRVGLSGGLDGDVRSFYVRDGRSRADSR